MSNKNRAMSAKELKVRMYDAKAFVRNYGNECARDYDECGRMYAPPAEYKPYTPHKLDFSNHIRVYFRDGRKIYFKNRLDAYIALTERGGHALRMPDGRLYGYRVRVWSVEKDRCVECFEVREIVVNSGIDLNNCTFMFM